ncbi:MAG: TRAP transporter small permease subunit [Gemmatimonadota bacterium]|nr:TRAP transporter small permease subunit [Gemmatimonadota bacterium]
MHFLRACVGIINRLNERIGVAVSWLTTVLVAVVCYDVFTRYLLKSSLVAVQELQWHLFAVIFLIGAAYTLKHGKHVRVDVFYNRFSARTRAWVDFLGSLIFLLPFCVVAIWCSHTFVINAFIIGEGSPDPGGLPARFILKAAIPVGFLLLALQGLALAFGSLFKIADSQARGPDAEQQRADV